MLIVNKTKNANCSLTLEGFHFWNQKLIHLSKEFFSLIVQVTLYLKAVYQLPNGLVSSLTVFLFWIISRRKLSCCWSNIWSLIQDLNPLTTIVLCLDHHECSSLERADKSVASLKCRSHHFHLDDENHWCLLMFLNNRHRLLSKNYSLNLLIFTTTLIPYFTLITYKDNLQINIGNFISYTHA